MIFRQWDEKVEAFPAERTNHTFAEAVSFGASIRRPQYSQSHACNRLIELRREDAVSVMDKKIIAMVRRYRFSKLLLCPGRRWVIRDMEM